MSPYFFRVEHDLLRSESFRTLGGSAIKIYLVIGLYSDFGTTSVTFPLAGQRFDSNLSYDSS